MATTTATTAPPIALNMAVSSRRGHTITVMKKRETILMTIPPIEATTPAQVDHHREDPPPAVRLAAECPGPLEVVEDINNFSLINQ